MYYYIYLTTNTVNGKKYIGQHATEDLNDGYIGSGAFIKQAIKKYGKENFKKEILEFAEDRETLNKLEIEYIKKYNAAKDRSFYNLTEGGEGVLGYTWSDERKEEASKRAKEDYIAGRRVAKGMPGELNPMFGRRGPLNPKFGTKASDETRKKLSQVVKEQYENGRVPPMLGKHWSDEVKKKISESHRGKWTGKDNPNYENHWSQEQRDKMSKYRKENGTCAGGKNGRAKAVECIETGIVYECATYASKEYHCDRHWIIDCCNGERELAGNVHWKYASNANTVPSEQETA